VPGAAVAGGGGWRPSGRAAHGNEQNEDGTNQGQEPYGQAPKASFYHGLFPHAKDSLAANRIDTALFEVV